MESCRLERERAVCGCYPRVEQDSQKQVNHLGKLTKDLWTAVLQQIKWVALLNLSLNKFFLRIVYSVITSCYFTRCKFYHNSCSMVQKCKVDKKQHPARAPCENHLTFDANHVGKFRGKQKSHSEILGLHSLIIENIAKWPLSDVFSLLILKQLWQSSS